jgi:phosphate uptake regulator
MVIATQQPVAGDLRALAAVFEIATELERIADYAKGIANITVSIGTGPRIAPPADLARTVYAILGIEPNPGYLAAGGRLVPELLG